jgi:hypothetical protein
LWVVVAGVGVAAGLRFFLLLPPLVLMAARGIASFGLYSPSPYPELKVWPESRRKRPRLPRSLGAGRP